MHFALPKHSWNVTAHVATVIAFVVAIRLHLEVLEARKELLASQEPPAAQQDKLSRLELEETTGQDLQSNESLKFGGADSGAFGAQSEVVNITSSELEDPVSKHKLSNVRRGTDPDIQDTVHNESRSSRKLQDQCEEPTQEPMCNKNKAFTYCGMWVIISGNCRIKDVEGEDCIVSPNYPGMYEGESGCEIGTKIDRLRPIKFREWNIDTGDEFTFVYSPRNMWREKRVINKDTDIFSPEVAEQPPYWNYDESEPAIKWTSASSCGKWRICAQNQPSGEWDEIVFRPPQEANDLGSCESLTTPGADCNFMKAKIGKDAVETGLDNFYSPCTKSEDPDDDGDLCFRSPKYGNDYTDGYGKDDSCGFLIFGKQTIRVKEFFTHEPEVGGYTGQWGIVGERLGIQTADEGFIWYQGGVASPVAGDPSLDTYRYTGRQKWNGYLHWVAGTGRRRYTSLGSMRVILDTLQTILDTGDTQVLADNEVPLLTSECSTGCNGKCPVADAEKNTVAGGYYCRVGESTVCTGAATCTSTCRVPPTCNVELKRACDAEQPSSFDISNVFGYILWEGGTSNLQRSDFHTSYKYRRWKFCVARDASKDWKLYNMCPKTCGSCEGEVGRLLNSCIDDPWLKDACNHFAASGVCTVADAMSKQAAWEASTGVSITVDAMFAQRMQEHCPYSCGMCRRCGTGKFRNLTVESALDPLACASCPDGRYRVQLELPSSPHEFECEICPPGQTNTEDRSDCQFCAPGRYGKTSFDGICDACPVGKFQDQGGMKECIDCQNGLDSDPGAVTCSNCTGGRYFSRENLENNKRPCVACKEGRYTDQEGETECLQCKIGKYADRERSSVCIDCPEGFTTNFLSADKIGDCVCQKGKYAKIATMKPNCATNCSDTYCETYGTCGAQISNCKTDYSCILFNTTCESCPPGLICEGGHGYADFSFDNTLLLTEETMSLPEAPTIAYTCMGSKNDEVCKGTRRAPMDGNANWAQVCGGKPHNRQGQACAACAEGYHMTKYGCTECATTDSFIMWLVAPGAFCGLAVAHVVWNKSPNKEKANSKRLTVLVNICAVYVQILGVFESVAIVWQSPFSYLFSFFKLARLDLSFLKMACGVSSSPSREYVSEAMVPLLGIGSVLTMYCVMKLARANVPEELIKEKLKVPQHIFQVMTQFKYYVNTSGSVYLAVSSGVTLLALLPYQCQDNPGGMLSVAQWPVVECNLDDPQYAAMVTYSSLAIIFYVTLFPVLCLRQVFLYPWALLHDSNFFVKYKFLFGNFSPTARHHGLVILSRNACIAFITALFMRDTFLQVSLMIGCVSLYMLAACVWWPWKHASSNWGDIGGSFCLSGIMVMGLGFIQQEIDQSSLLILLTFIFASIIGSFSFAILHSLFSVVGNRFEYSVFLSHAKGTGGAVARLFKMTLGTMLSSRSKIFLDSDNLVSLHELHVFVQHTRHLLLLLTDNACWAREWVCVEIVTVYTHKVDAMLVSVNGIEPMDEAFVNSIPSVFKPQLEGRFKTMGINEELVMNSYFSMSLKKKDMLHFDTYAELEVRKISFESILRRMKMNTKDHGDAFERCQEAIAEKIKQGEKTFDAVISYSLYNVGNMFDSRKSRKEDHTARLYICRETDCTIQQEASVLCLDLLLKELMHGEVFLPSSTDTLSVKDDRMRVMAKGGGLILCLTRNALCDPIFVAEICAAAISYEMFIIPVQVDDQFMFPGDAFYQDMLTGKVLDLGLAADDQSLYVAFEQMTKRMFEDIAIAFVANGAMPALRSAAASIVKRYKECEEHSQKGADTGQASGVVGRLGDRLEPFHKRDLIQFLEKMKSTRQTMTRTHGLGQLSKAPAIVMPSRNQQPRTQAPALYSDLITEVPETIGKARAKKLVPKAVEEEELRGAEPQWPSQLGRPKVSAKASPKKKAQTSKLDAGIPPVAPPAARKPVSKFSKIAISGPEGGSQTSPSQSREEDEEEGKREAKVLKAKTEPGLQAGEVPDQLRREQAAIKIQKVQKGKMARLETEKRRLAAAKAPEAKGIGKGPKPDSGVSPDTKRPALQASKTSPAKQQQGQNSNQVPQKEKKLLAF